MKRQLEPDDLKIDKHVPMMRHPADLRRMLFSQYNVMEQYIIYSAESKAFKQWADTPDAQGQTLWTYLLRLIWTKPIADPSRFQNTRWLYFAFACVLNTKRTSFGIRYFTIITAGREQEIQFNPNYGGDAGDGWMLISTTIEKSTAESVAKSLRYCCRQWIDVFDFHTNTIRLEEHPTFISLIANFRISRDDISSIRVAHLDVPIIAAAAYFLFELGFRYQTRSSTGHYVAIRGCNNCGDMDAQMDCGGNCGTAVYCNQLCADNDWSNHTTKSGCK